MINSQPLPADMLNDAGLNRQHVFNLADLPPEFLNTLAPAPGERQLILIGHAGRRLWSQLCASGIDSEHPIDDYTVDTVSRWFATVAPGCRCRFLYPGDHPIGLQHLGKLAGWHHPSPFMIGVDAEWGSWYAYRAVILTDTDFAPYVRVDRSHPCASCAGRPCLAACPAEALSDGKFDLARCLAYRKSENSRCELVCIARTSCPVGAEHRYDDAQLAHTYGRSLNLIKGQP